MPLIGVAHLPSSALRPRPSPSSVDELGRRWLEAAMIAARTQSFFCLVRARRSVIPTLAESDSEWDFRIGLDFI